jgi:hypothetical protein
MTEALATGPLAGMVQAVKRHKKHANGTVQKVLVGWTGKPRSRSVLAVLKVARHLLSGGSLTALWRLSDGSLTAL